MNSIIKTLVANIMTIINKFLDRFLSYALIRTVTARMSRKQNKIVLDDWDYVRISIFEMVAYEITRQNLEGNVAELGVYKGDFARIINTMFPDKKLYLFDTFEGFSDKDIEKEEKHGYSNANENFSDTSVDYVKNRMKYLEQCTFVKGYFPDSATNIDDTFCFVSLDADLFEPIYAGLCFFYPKMVQGGYIFVHDYNNDTTYQGVQEAVRKFASEHGLHFVPLPDALGSVVFVKV